MTRYVVQHLLMMLLTLIGVSLIVFMLIRLLPGSIVDQILGIESVRDPADIQRIQAMFGLDQPVAVQYATWLGRILTGNLDTSYRTGRSVQSMIAETLPLTVELATGAIVVSLVIGVPTGVVAALRQNRGTDMLLRIGTLLGLSIPSFWQGTILILIFSYYLRWAPPVSWVSPFEDLGANLRMMILPVITLGTASSAAIQRYTRIAMLDVMRQDYVRTARAKGLPEGKVIYLHALRNCLIPVVTVLGLELGALLGGAAVTEQVFTLPGVGRLVLEGIYGRDYPVIQGTVLLIASAFIVVNFVVDLLYAVLNPRIRYS
jgi:peptide/nickel transport system permease protein